VRTISESCRGVLRSRVGANRNRATNPHSPGWLIPHALTGTVVLASLLLIAGEARAQLTKWDATGLIGVLPPASQDKSSVVVQIRGSLAALRVREAAEAALSLIQQQPQNYEGYFWTGFAEFQQGNYFAAVKSLRRAEKLGPAGNSVQKVLGLAYLELQQDVLFELKMKDAIALDPTDFAPHYSLARYLQSQKRDSTLAAQEYLLVLERKPDHNEALYYLGLIREQIWDLLGAKSLYERAIAAAERAGVTFSLPYQGLSRLARMRGDPAGAVVYATRSVSLEPKSPDNQRELGTVYAELGRVPESVAAFRASLALDPNDSSVYYQLASLYRRAGDRTAADEVLAQFNRVSACYPK
jgi:tetratricopeptide (TPR) repeat protein